METLIAFVAGAASVVAAALLAPRVKGVYLSKAVAPARQLVVGVIAAAYRTGDAVGDATAGARRDLSKLVDEGRERARSAEHRATRAARKAHAR